EKDDIVLESVDKKTLPALSQVSHHNRDSSPFTREVRRRVWQRRRWPRAPQ
ncbi:hypothetical protein Goarm_008789, partial [Gossypium armourianum]|nr:hypothetical protein [Gossypium armourianum]